MTKETKVCDACRTEKPITQFSIAGRDGYRNRRCKVCVTFENNPTDRKVCRACGIEKPILQFPTNGKNGVKAPRCKICKNNNVLIPKDKRLNVNGRRFSSSRLSNVTKDDYTNMYIFLRDIMGYDITSHLSIHEQFCLKYNLTPHNPPNSFPEHFSVEDCF